MLQDRSIAASALAFSCLYVYATLSIPVLDNIDPVGPRVYPLILGAGFAVSSLWLFMETVFAGSQQSGQNDNRQDGRTKSEWMTVISVSAWMVVYFIALVPLGFLISSSLFLLGLSSYFNRNRFAANAITSVLFSIGMYALFTRVLQVPLPGGLLGF